MAWSREFHKARSLGTRDHVITREEQDNAAARHAIIVRYCAESTVRLAYPEGFVHTQGRFPPVAPPTSQGRRGSATAAIRRRHSQRGLRFRRMS